jgi:hypothetical protein
VTEDLHTPATAGPVPPSAVEGAHAGSDHTANGGPLPGPLGNLPVDAHPEILVGAAFAGGLVVAFVLKRLGR